MYYQAQHNEDDKIDAVLGYLFQYEKPALKQIQYERIMAIFEQIDIAAMYFLFSLICERLPGRAKMLFSGEDYEGKKQVILEVMQNLAYSVEGK
jgi:hypothetical protein